MKRESAKEIAARIRAGIGPTRPMVVRCLERAENERFITNLPQ